MNTLRLLRLGHFAGLILFLGSIFSFILITNLAQNEPLSDLAFARRIISAGTTHLTLPGLWLLAVTGLGLGLLKYGAGSRFFRIKLLLTALIVINAHLFVAPAVNRASSIAMESLAAGHLGSAYSSAFKREEMFGVTNVLLALATAVVAVWRLGTKGRTGKSY